MARCKSCRAEILWIKTKAGKAMPVDPEPVCIFLKGDGDTVIVTEEGETLRGNRAKDVVVGHRVEYDAVGYISHFATCPSAKKHRKK